jgi:hypothetical protein
MSKANDSTTTSRDGWRQHQLRRRAAGKGKHPLPGGRYSPLKRTLHNGVIDRPNPLAFISQSEAETLAELCTLTAYSDGFTFTEPMMAICKVIANRSTPAARRVCLVEAAARELAYVAR